jgi:S-DNA-T family DNA segregation ATPase FtsK/SpoIIIE
LSVLARQGRAFGIHLLLSTQRPDATLIPGQIRTNIGTRICGRADQILSQIVLDNSDAAKKIDKDACGRFLMNDGTLFQGFWIDDETAFK